MRFVVLSLFYILVGCACFAAPIFAGELKGVKLSSDDRAFFTYLDDLGREQKEFVRTMVILLALGEGNDAPVDLPSLIQAIAVDKIAPVPEDQFSRAVKGIKQLSAKRIHDALVLVTTGNGKYIDGEKFASYRPTGDVLKLLKCMETRYRKLVAGD